MNGNTVYLPNRDEYAAGSGCQITLNLHLNCSCGMGAVSPAGVKPQRRMKHAQTPPTFWPLCRLLGHPPVRLDPDVRSATPGSLAVARSEIEASHRHRPVDRQLPRDNAVNRIFAV